MAIITNTMLVISRTGKTTDRMYKPLEPKAVRRGGKEKTKAKTQQMKAARAHAGASDYPQTQGSC